MARNIYCEKCYERVEVSCLRFKEFIESQKGLSLSDMFCDSCGNKISIDQLCYACCLLPYRSHPNYEWQKPSVWADQYIISEAT